jgi:prepilin peptidase CpaA
MQELQLLLELITMLVMDPRNGVLIALLLVGAVIDVRTYRIPNWLTLPGTAFALIYSVIVPFSPAAGFLWSLGGLFLGVMVMLPMYVLRAMGAGDVKLMAMAGAFLGVDATLQAIVSTLITGGILALGFALYRGAAGRMLGNIRQLAMSTTVAILGGVCPSLQVTPAASVGKLPYGVSIGIGTIGSMLARQLGYL